MTLRSISAEASLPRRDTPTSGGETEQRQLAWQREMERAQMTAWFKPSVATSQRSAAGPPNHREDAAARQEARGGGKRPRAPVGAEGGDAILSRTALPASLIADLTAGTGGGDMRGQPPRTTASAYARTPTIFITEQGAESKVPSDTQVLRMEVIRPSAGTRVIDDLAKTLTGAPTEIRPDSRPKASMPSEQTPALLRLHEETLPEGQAVWIAMRADDEALAAMLPQIVADLQRGLSQSRGQRLCQVVCNGRLVWRAGASATAPDGQLYSGGDVRLGVFHPIQSKGA
ncbi:hypothetical protein [Variovorax sp. OV700]|uniref:hypothetical protein n=1 Tax=Variovorax sp. OV700 TaxID=1882826 RepID=UPI000A569C9C|nr:hypothetical protein [Variovorax sp. OV700]